MSPRRIRTYSPAALALAGAGTTQAQLAELAGCSVMAVSRYLAGHRSMPDTFTEALSELVGPEDAGRILAVIPQPEAVPA